MDPVSQFAWGGALAVGASRVRKEDTKIALMTGGLSGLLADLDVFIRSAQDPLLQIEYHRHFTHALLFIPVGALISLLLIKVLLFVFRTPAPSSATLILYCLLGYGSHGFLDACTSYGTQLFWPFTSDRIAWSVIGIVDPFFTVVILGLLLLSFLKRKPLFARAALVYGLLYLLFGLFQRNQVTDFAYADMQQRSVTLSSRGCEAKPSPLSLFLWRSICESNDGRFLVDAWHVSPLKKVKYSGGEILRFNPDRDAPWLRETPRQQRDLKRFEWFSSGYIATHPEFPNVIADIRYSLIPNQIKPLWGIELDSNNRGDNRPMPWKTFRSIREGDWREFMRMVQGSDTKAPQ